MRLIYLWLVLVDVNGLLLIIGMCLLFLDIAKGNSIEQIIKYVDPLIFCRQFGHWVI